MIQIIENIGIIAKFREIISRPNEIIKKFIKCLPAFFLVYNFHSNVQIKLVHNVK